MSGSSDYLTPQARAGGLRGAPGRFGDVITAMITPFDEDDRLDLPGAVTLAGWLCEHGSDALVLAGSTGEASTMTDSEKADLWRTVAEAVDVPVIANTGSADTRHAVELTRVAEECGVAGILAVTPYYNRPPQSGVEEHFLAMASATTLPVLLYDIPVRTGRKIAPATIMRLIEKASNIVGIKDAAGDVAATALLLASAPDGFEVYSGEDSLTLALVAVGACGVIGVATHWAGEVFAEMISAHRAGDVVSARRANAALMDSYAFESTEAAPNPIPTKAAMRALGLPAGQCRLPLGQAPSGLDDRARDLLAGLSKDGITNG